MKLILVPIVAILAIAGLITYALYLNINGTLLAGGMVIIGGLGGWTGKVFKDRISKQK